MSLSCYAHCPEDRELMGQREARLNSPACEWVKDQQANGGDKTTATSTATINASKTGSAIANASKTSTIGKSTATKTATGKETPTSTAYKGQPPREGDLQDLSGAAEAVYSGATLIARGTALAVIAMIV